MRLTADNVVPDGRLVQELEANFRSRGVDYLCHSYPESRLPYGLVTEAFTVATLRKADAAARAHYDREHVTPWIARNCRSACLVPVELASLDLSHLRCTVDDRSDYERIVRLFQDVADPIRIRWIDLARKLSEMPGEPKFRVSWKVSGKKVQSELVLGTAQLGMEYGIANKTGEPSRSAANKIVRTAIAHGVTSIDTARAYGDSEPILGEALSGAWRSRVDVVTKLDPFASLASDASTLEARNAVDESVRRSCEALGVKQLSTLLLHRWKHYYQWKGAVWERLLEVREEGRIASLGASVYEPEEALAAIEDPEIRHLQIPMNVLDWRWKAAGVDRAFLRRPEIVIHARSALLQGLLADSGVSWPLASQFDAARFLRSLRDFARRSHRENVIDLCLAYVRSLPWITSVVVGCETLGQLEQNLRLFCTPHLTAEQCDELESSLPVAPEELLNPSKWNLGHERSA